MLHDSALYKLCLRYRLLLKVVSSQTEEIPMGHSELRVSLADNQPESDPSMWIVPCHGLGTKHYASSSMVGNSVDKTFKHVTSVSDPDSSLGLFPVS